LQGIAGLGTLLVFLSADTQNPYLTWGLLGTIVIGQVAAAYVVTIAILRPLHDLSRALVHISGELSSDTPPSLNDPYYANNNLRPLLQQIYELASKDTDATPPDETTTVHAKTPNLAAALNTTTTGLIFLNATGEIVFSNKAAPVSVDSDGTSKLNLIFDTDEPFEQWLVECRTHDIHAEHLWRRVANKLPGEEGRRLFDVFASYEKESEAEVVITLFDRTNEYSPEEEDLDFISFAAHELRGPITVIRGYLDGLSDELATVMDAEQKELFNRLIISANRLSGYINNILNASRYDRRHLQVHLNEVAMTDIYEMIADDMQLRAAAQRRVLSVDLPVALPTVAADANSISEVLGNLIDNAIKYSNDGGTIEVTAAVAGEFVEVSVTDHGIGMPSNVVGNLFHKFYRSHRSRETVAGTGIGLYISKAVVESHGGKINVRSVEGHGSTFTFSLPIFATVADKLAKKGANNQDFIEHSSSGWIRNHGAIRG
ncbi:HAMP domain-containing histidine kinase, partial [Candidatus Saccharibacteria bacterium]|nr:HAMP domain-containing histidine kinase [Candidatus Saccharibacteria bacterium]